VVSLVGVGGLIYLIWKWPVTEGGGLARFMDLFLAPHGMDNSKQKLNTKISLEGAWLLETSDWTSNWTDQKIGPLAAWS